jgi:NTE family protein
VTTAFVLSGGASLGAVQVGMLQALGEQGIRPDLLVGTSVGAINAAWVAGRPDPGHLDELAELWGSMRSRQVFPVSPAGAVTGLLARRNHLVSGSGLEELLTRHLPYDRLEEAEVPVHVVATELLTGRERLLSDGPAVPALLASCAIPAIYPPVEIRGRLYIDGGVSANSPVSHAVDLGADTVYVLPTGYACALPRPPGGVIGMALHALTILLQRQLIHDVERNQDRAQVHVMPPLCPLAVFPGDFRHSAELIDRAHEETRRYLVKGGRAGAALLAFHGRHSQRPDRSRG